MDLKNLKNLSSPKYKVSLISLFVIGGGFTWYAFTSYGGGAKGGGARESQGEARLDNEALAERRITRPTAEDYANNENTEIGRIYQHEREKEKEKALEGDGSYVFTISNPAKKEKPASKPKPKPVVNEEPAIALVNSLKNNEENSMDTDQPPSRPSFHEQLAASKKEEKRVQVNTNFAPPATAGLEDFMAQISQAAAFDYQGRPPQRDVGNVAINRYEAGVDKTEPGAVSNSKKDPTNSETGRPSDDGDSPSEYADHIGAMPVTEMHELIEIEPGDIFYTRLQIGINTDEISPIRAEVLGGELAGAVLLGGPRRVGKKAIIELTKMSFRGVTFEIDAVALDLETKRTALADDVDTHYGKNLFYLTLASIVSGYGQSLQEWEETSSGTSDVDTMKKAKIDKFEDRLMVGLGEAGEEVKSILTDQINRAPTVYVYPKDIGIMFMSELNIGSQK